MEPAPNFGAPAVAVSVLDLPAAIDSPLAERSISNGSQNCLSPGAEDVPKMSRVLTIPRRPKLLNAIAWSTPILMVAWLALPWLARASAADAATADGPTPDSPENSAEVFRVTRTFDGAKFDCRMQLRAKRPGFRVYRLTYPSPVVTPVKQNNTIPADYYLPDGIELGGIESGGIESGGPRRPAVVCLHILQGNFELAHMTCSLLASQGIPAIMFKLPYYGERSLPGGRDALRKNRRLLIEALTQGLQDVRRTVDVLASRPEIDPRRIGITGISLGGNKRFPESILNHYQGWCRISIC